MRHVIADFLVIAGVAWLVFEAALWIHPTSRARRLRRKHAASDWYGVRNMHHCLNLFDAHRQEREHPRDIVQTDRYRAWLTKRDNA